MFEKMNTVILNNLLKREAGKKHENMLYTDDDGFVYVCIGGTRMHRALKSKVMIDLGKLKQSDSIARIFKESNEAITTPAYYTGTTITKDKIKLAEYKDDTGRRFYYNLKLLEEFGKLDSFYLMVSEKQYAPAIIVTANYNFEMGLILPVRV